ncbi:MAG: tRNA adenosine(34) deaminase TadA [Pyrinomonadaceae bacterium]
MAIRLNSETMIDEDENWMWRAIHVAREAEKLGEVPVGAVIIDADGKILAATSNRTIKNNDPTAHAEILALRTAAIRTGNYRLTGTTMYTTIEPCAMCAGALVNARVARVVYGAADERFGAVETHFRVCDSPDLNHRMEITSGVLADKCRSLMQNFFQARRKKSEPPA